MYSVVTMMSKSIRISSSQKYWISFYIVFLHHVVTSYLVVVVFIYQRPLITYHFSSHTRVQVI